MGQPGWSAYDEGYLRAYQWAASLGAGTALPHEATSLQLGPGEVAHAQVAPVNVVGYYGENVEYRPSVFLLGGPVGLALTGAASIAHNQTKKRDAERAAVPRWHQLGMADLVMTSQRLALSKQERVESFWYAESGAPDWAAGGTPAIQLQPAGMPLLRLETPWAPLLYVFVHHLLDGRPPGVPLPDGLLDRARVEGRLA
jgi:hypothetical protein